MPRLTASLSFDLDNLWSYMKTHGDPGWEQYPSYLSLLAPIALDWLKRHGQTVTFFVVGRDATLAYNREPLARIAAAGHEFGNHSFNHEQWMQDFDEPKVVDELRRTEDAICEASGGLRPLGFRGPGFCSSPAILSALRRLDYQYDASILPSLLGPAARLYYLWGTRMSKEESAKRSELFGPMRNGLLPLRPFEWQTPLGNMLEIPVTTIPILRVPFHLSYIIWLSSFSKFAALRYLNFAFAMCRLWRVEPSFLLHPLDFLGREDVPQLGFFPGMNLPRAHKLEMADRFLTLYRRHFEVVPLSEHVRRIRARGNLKVVVPQAPEERVPAYCAGQASASRQDMSIK